MTVLWCAFSHRCVWLWVQGTAVFFVTGGSCWMLCYSLCPKIVADEAEATEATRLLNLTTQVGVLVGILVGMILMDELG